MARNKNYEALIKAVKNDDVKGARRLIESKKIETNHMENDGAALHHAMSAAMVDLLCDKGANPNQQYQTLSFIGGYYAPIHTAANGDVIRALARRGADITLQGGIDLQTAMHLADKPEIVDALMECGGEAILNQRDANGNTPLDLAGYGSKPHDMSVRRCLQKHNAKEGAALDQEHAELVAAKKKEAEAFPRNTNKALGR